MNIKHFKDLDGCLSYVIESGNECVAIDVSINTGQYVDHLMSNGYHLKAIVDTHIHADHITGAALLKENFDVQIIMSENHKEQIKLAVNQAPDEIQELLRKNADVSVDKYVMEGETLEIGGTTVRFMETPGHTIDMISLYVEGTIFSGDSLHIGGIARTDLPGGCNETMYRTLNEKFLPLPEGTLLYPGHDYHGNIISVIGYEIVNNPFMKAKTLEQFANTVSKAFGPIKPGMSCSANVADDKGELSPMQKSMCMAVIDYANNHAGEYTLNAKNLQKLLGDVLVLDVRSPSEYADGHVPGAINVPVGSEIVRAVDDGRIPADKQIVAVCKSGARAAMATMYLRVRGFDVISLDGGTDSWANKGFELEM